MFFRLNVSYHMLIVQYNKLYKGMQYVVKWTVHCTEVECELTSATTFLKSLVNSLILQLL